jgi:hypothetical protein
MSISSRPPGRGADAPSTNPAAAPSADGSWFNCTPLRTAVRACCCSAQPVVEALVPRHDVPGTSEQLLLCSHHFRQSKQKLDSVGAVVFDADGQLIMPLSWEIDAPA